jgi:O-antigen ligase
MDIFIFYGVYLGVALLFSAGAVFAVGGALHAGTRRPEGFLIYFSALMMMVAFVSTISSGRDLMQAGALELMSGPAGGGAAKWFQRLVMLFLLAVSAERLARFAFRPRQAESPGLLMLAFALCWVGMVALPAAFGTRPTLDHEYFYAIPIGLAALTTTDRGAQTAIRVTRNSLLLFALASLLVLAVKRDMVLAPYIGGLIPAFPWRYSGLSTGPNAMGPLCVLGLLALWSCPFEKRWLQRLAQLVLLFSLLLTQSKSSWLGGLACWISVAWVVRLDAKAQWFGDQRRRPALQTALLLMIVLVLAVFFIIATGVIEERLERFLVTRAGSDLVTLTGRNEIWVIALDTFWRNPWFGYGPAIWDPYFRYIIGVPAAFHAHNQFINVLAASGLVGAIGFLAYLVALFMRLLKRLRSYRGFAVGVLALILVRCVGEVPFNLDGLGGESLMHILLLMVLAGAPTDQATRTAREALGQKEPAHG